MIPHGLCGFGRESSVPMIRIEPISNFDLFYSIDLLMKGTAMSDQSIIGVVNDGK